MKASILTIGDELLNGSTLNTNTRFIAQKAIEIGLDISEMLTVADNESAILEALDYVRKKSEIVFITGGLGPTKDDITIATLAKYTQNSLIFSEEVYNRVVQRLKDRGITNIHIDKENCKVPKTAILLENEKGTAPAIWLENKGVVLIAMPGAPFEMKHLLLNAILPKVKKEYDLPLLINKYLMTVGVAESKLAEKIKDIEEKLPANITLAYLPSLGKVKLRLSGKNALAKDVDFYFKQIQERLAKYIYAYNPAIALSQAIGEKLQAKNQTITLAESCSGGKIAHKITSVAGSSTYFKGSIVAYSNEIKNKVLGVPFQTIENYGVVSEPTAVAMAKGAMKLIGADYGIGVTGIAGPTGETANQKVGTVCIAVCSNDEILSKTFQFLPHRAENIELSAINALNLLRKLIA